MISVSKRLRTSVAAALVLAGVATLARGQVSGDGGSSFGAPRGMMRIKGSVVCAGCSLEEVHKAQPMENKLYQLSYRHGQVVMKVTEVNEPAVFDMLAWPPRLWVRGADSLLQRLGAEENLFKEMTVVGLLSGTRTLDIFDVTIKG
jgi:hypothetical protein